MFERCSTLVNFNNPWKGIVLTLHAAVGNTEISFWNYLHTCWSDTFSILKPRNQAAQSSVSVVAICFCCLPHERGQLACLAIKKCVSAYRGICLRTIRQVNDVSNALLISERDVHNWYTSAGDKNSANVI